MTAFANIGRERIISGSINMPYYGEWVADFVLAQSNVIPVTGPVTVGNLTMTGSVFRMASFSGSRSTRVVGGYAGWRTPVTKRAYQSSGGVPLSMVLGDAAAEVGEQVNVQTNGFVGTNFVREAATASRLLRQLAGPEWWIDVNGVTQVGSARPSSVITSDFQVIRWSGAKGMFTIATEDYASWLPGNTFSNSLVTTPQTISNVTIVMGNDGNLRLEVLVTP